MEPVIVEEPSESTADALLTIDSNIAYCSCKTFVVNAKKIVCNMSLQKYKDSNWTTVETWKKTVNGSVLNFKEKKGVKSGKYRVKAVVSVTRSSGTEKITKYSTVVKN